MSILSFASSSGMICFTSWRGFFMSWMQNWVWPKSPLLLGSLGESLLISIWRSWLRSTIAFITGMVAVEMAFMSWIISHFWRLAANRSRFSIIFSLSGRTRLVTAISISLDSSANPVTSDPNYLILGTCLCDDPCELALLCGEFSCDTSSFLKTSSHMA